MKKLIKRWLFKEELETLDSIWDYAQGTQKQVRMLGEIVFSPALRRVLSKEQAAIDILKKNTGLEPADFEKLLEEAGD